MQQLQFVGILLEIIILFNFIILVHELGHYLAARWRGLRVDKFQIWFGKPIWSKKINGVQWGMGWIPAGGFVALPQMAPMEMLEGAADDGGPLPPIKPLDKIIVAIAGPLFSFALAIVFAYVVWGIGHPVSKENKSTTIGYISKDEKAPKELQQFRLGDVIKEVDNRPVQSWMGMTDSVKWNIISSQGDMIRFKVERDGKEQFIEIPAKAAAQKNLKDIGFWAKFFGAIQGFFTRPELREVAILPAHFPMVGKTVEKSPAAKAGLKPNDLIVGLNGAKLMHPAEITDAIKVNPTVKLDVVRGGGQPFSVTITAKLPREKTPPAAIETDDKSKEKKEPQPMLGIEWDATGETEIVHPTPREQIEKAGETMYNTLTSVASPKSDVSARHLSGPLGIGRVYYHLFSDKDGWRRAFWFSVILNINLAILNMLPLPVLDGGHILMALIEWIRRRPINLRVLEFVQAGCAIALIGFMIYLTGFDVRDLFGGKKHSELEFPTDQP